MDPIENEFGECPEADGTVTLGSPVLEIARIHFAKSDWSADETLADPAPLMPEYVQYLYRNESAHPIASGDLKGWAKGAKITEPEWENGRADSENLPACFIRKNPIFCSVCLVCETAEDLKGDLEVLPSWDGIETSTPTAVSFTYPGGAEECWIDIETDAVLPDEVGKFTLKLAWSASGSGFEFGGPEETTHAMYVIYGPPMKPDYDSDVSDDPGEFSTAKDGTLSGTPQRMDKIMSLLGSRHAAATDSDLEDIVWLLHKGISDSTPPYFDGGHDEYISEDGTNVDADTRALDLEDQWLMWVKSAAESVRNSDGRHNHWNDSSCIGHVQLLKTMAAAVGIFIRRAWILPHTTQFPSGLTVTFADSELYLLGQNVSTLCYDLTLVMSADCSGYQVASITHPHYAGAVIDATPKLMEPGGSFEQFEACTRTPGGKFLPGGYPTSSCPAEFSANKGFGSAAEVLRWWANTFRQSGTWKRFMAWVGDDGTTVYCFDKDGGAYTVEDYTQIRDTGKELPPP